jgi:hypothetical protein
VDRHNVTGEIGAPASIKQQLNNPVGSGREPVFICFFDSLFPGDLLGIWGESPNASG